MSLFKYLCIKAAMTRSLRYLSTAIDPDDAIECIYRYCKCHDISKLFNIAMAKAGLVQHDTFDTGLEYMWHTKVHECTKYSGLAILPVDVHHLADNVTSLAKQQCRQSNNFSNGGIITWLESRFVI